MSPPTQRSGAPPSRERPASEDSSHRQAAGHAKATAPGRRLGVVMLPVRSLTLALDELDERGLCACWVAGRRCPRRRWSR